MTRQFIEDEVSIYSLPTLDTNHLADKNAQITVGDLHGNAMKLMFVLVRHGIVTNMDAERYNELVRLYKTDVDRLTAEDIKRFNDILCTLTFNQDAMIRLLGDELCDRGSNDYFTLKIIQKLYENKVPCQIILSNHSIEFIEAYETKLKFFPTVLEPRFAQSMINLQILITRKLITKEEVRAIFRESYKPLLSAIAYSLNEDSTSIMIYSHAPIDLRAIRSMAKKLKIPFNDASAIDLAKTIDNINEIYQQHVSHNTVHTLYDKEAMEFAYNVTPIPSSQYPFEYTMWNRDLRFLKQPATHKGYQLFFAHGHDSQESENKNVFNLDNQLGKTMQSDEGQYTALYSHEQQLKPKETLLSTGDRESLRASMKLFGRLSTNLKRDSQTDEPKSAMSH